MKKKATCEGYTNMAKEPVLLASKELIERAVKFGWRIDEVNGELYYGSGKCTGLLTGSKSFMPVEYLGTLYIRRGKLRGEDTFRVNRGAYASSLLMEALRVLKSKKIWLFVHTRLETRPWQVLLLGTEKGTVTIAPKVASDYRNLYLDYPCISTVAKFTKRTQRALAFSAF